MTGANVVETSPAANKGTPGSADEGSGDGGGRGSPSLPSEDAILKQVMSNLGITEEALKEKVLEHFDIESFSDVAGLTDADVDSILTEESIGIDRKHRMRLVFLFRTLRTGGGVHMLTSKSDLMAHLASVPTGGGAPPAAQQQHQPATSGPTVTINQDVKLQRLPADAEKNVSVAIQWIEGVESYMGRIGSKALLTVAPGPRDTKSDQFFLALLQQACRGTNAEQNALAGVKSGHRAWLAIVKYLIGKDKADLIKSWAKKSRKKLRMQESTRQAFDSYAAAFRRIARIQASYGGGYREKDRQKDFLKGIVVSSLVQFKVLVAQSVEAKTILSLDTTIGAMQKYVDALAEYSPTDTEESDDEDVRDATARRVGADDRNKGLERLTLPQNKWHLLSEEERTAIKVVKAIDWERLDSLKGGQESSQHGGYGRGGGGKGKGRSKKKDGRDGKSPAVLRRTPSHPSPDETVSNSNSSTTSPPIPIIKPDSNANGTKEESVGDNTGTKDKEEVVGGDSAPTIPEEDADLIATKDEIAKLSLRRSKTVVLFKDAKDLNLELSDEDSDTEGVSPTPTSSTSASTKSSKKKTRKKRSSTATSTNPSTGTSSTSGKSDTSSEKTTGQGLTSVPRKKHRRNVGKSDLLSHCEQSIASASPGGTNLPCGTKTVSFKDLPKGSSPRTSGSEIKSDAINTRRITTTNEPRYVRRVPVEFKESSNSASTSTSRSIRIRRVTLESEGLPAPESIHAVVDGGCDQTVLGKGVWVFHVYKTLVHVNGGLAGMKHAGSCPLQEICGAYVVRNTEGVRKLMVFERSIHNPDPNQYETLVQPNALRAFGHSVCDVAHRYGGKQEIRTEHDVFPLFFDGIKCNLPLEAPTQEDVDTLERVYVTSSDPYQPQAGITNVIRRNIVENLDKWRPRLGWVNDDIIRRTLQTTTQLVDSLGNRDQLRRHVKSRLPMLQARRLSEEACMDTFFSAVRSVRGYTMGQLYHFKESKLVKVYLMKRKSQVPSTLQDVIRDVGAPYALRSDNALEESSKKVNQICRSMVIKQRYTEPDNQQQNPAERSIGDLKVGTLRLLRQSGAPADLWCYAAEHYEKLMNVYARKALDWQCSHTKNFGETKDISVFQYSFYQPVYYLDPNVPFPHDNMLPGRWVGIEETTGDEFTWRIIPEHKDKRKNKNKVALIRGTVKPRDANDLKPRRHYPNIPSDLLSRNEEDFLNRSRLESDRPSKRQRQADGDEAVTYDEMQSTILGQGQNPMERNAAQPQGASHSADALVDVSETSGESQDDDQSETIRPITGPSVSDRTRSTSRVMDVEWAEEQPSRRVTSVRRATNYTGVSPYKYGKRGLCSPEEAREAHQPYSDDEDDGSYIENDYDHDEAGILNEFARSAQDAIDSGTSSETIVLRGITGHRFKKGELQLKVFYESGNEDFVAFDLLKHDEPLSTATYILSVDIDQSIQGRYTRWARSIKRAAKLAARRVRRLQHLVFDDGDDVSHSSTVRRTNNTSTSKSNKKKSQSRKKKLGKNNRTMGAIKYGVKVPRDVKEALAMDKENGNDFWEQAIKKELASLDAMECFIYKSPSFKPGDDYQYAPLRMIFDVKSDLTRKARLVVGGHVIDADHLNSYASVVKGQSVRLLQCIADNNNLDTLCGDVSNAFVNAKTKEKVYCRAGPEFLGKEGCILIIHKSLYGLKTSAERWHSHFSDTLRSMGFVPTRYDRDVWIRPRGGPMEDTAPFPRGANPSPNVNVTQSRTTTDNMSSPNTIPEEDGYDYICTHVDDFKIVAKDCWQYMHRLQKVYLIKNIGPPEYYLGNDYTHHNGKTYIGCKTYVTEAVARIERLFGTLRKARSPMEKGDHPELDESPLLDDEGTREYQMLVGMANWIVILGRWDIAFAVNSLSRFNSCPREGHRIRALRLYGYLKKYRNIRVKVDTRELIVQHAEDFEEFDADFSDAYPDAQEEIDEDLPSPKGAEMPIATFFDSDHAHDRVTRRSCTGVLQFVGRTPVTSISKRQGSVETSTYGAEFNAMRTATEETMALRYMLRSLGVPVTQPTKMFGDNLGVIQNASMPDSMLKKKHTAIAYHRVREAVAASIIKPYHIDGEFNPSDVLTKSLGASDHIRHVKSVMY